MFSLVINSRLSPAMKQVVIGAIIGIGGSFIYPIQKVVSIVLITWFFIVVSQELVRMTTFFVPFRWIGMRIVLLAISGEMLKVIAYSSFYALTWSSMVLLMRWILMDSPIYMGGPYWILGGASIPIVNVIVINFMKLLVMSESR